MIGLSCFRKLFENVYAIATGLSDGLGLGDNARAALLTRSTNEMINLEFPLVEKAKLFLGSAGLVI